MIVVDSSALIAVLLNEPEHLVFEDIIAGAERCVISAVNAHETATVLRLRHGARAVDRFWQFLTDVEIEIIPFHQAQVRAAAVAFDRYGKGIDSRARLNLSDCAAYALAKTMDAPLLAPHHGKPRAPAGMPNYHSIGRFFEDCGPSNSARMKLLPP